MAEENPLRKIRIEKITLNVGVGKDEETMKRGLKLLKKITGIEPIKTVTKKRIPAWELRPGLQIGCKLTLRKKKAEELLRLLLKSKDNNLPEKKFDKQGNFSFGIPEYIDIPGVDYDPELKVLGLEVAVTLERPGYKVKKRKVQPRKIGKAHLITPAEAKDFMKKEFGVNLV